MHSSALTAADSRCFSPVMHSLNIIVPSFQSKTLLDRIQTYRTECPQGTLIARVGHTLHSIVSFDCIPDMAQMCAEFEVNIKSLFANDGARDREPSSKR